MVVNADDPKTPEPEGRTMWFGLTLAVFLTLVASTVIGEYRRSKTLTPLSLISLGNILYMGVNPVLYHYFPSAATIFERYVSDTGMTIDESGLLRMLLAATIFQLVCLCVSLAENRERTAPDAIENQSVLRAAIVVGWVLTSIGALGAVWLGLKYNGHFWGLYEISYVERATLARDNSLQAFLLLVGIYGAAQLIVAYLLSGRTKSAVLILFAIVLHGLGMKSKFPIFWVLVVFCVVAIAQSKKFFRLFLPIGVAVLILSTMSILRGFENFSELPDFVETHWDLLMTTAVAPWNNDLPGPASVTYYALNSNVDYSVRPATEILWLMVPRFLFDRGPVLADVWGEKMLGSAYQPGFGLGWSSICDGFLLLGWLGIGLVAFAFAMLARFVDNLRNLGGKYQEFFMIVVYSSAPLFLYTFRQSSGGIIKQMVIMAVLIWLPTFYLAQREEGVRLVFRPPWREGSHLRGT